MLKTYTIIEGNCGGVTSNLWKTVTTIEVNCGGLTLNTWKTINTKEGNYGFGWFWVLKTATQHGVWYGTNVPSPSIHCPVQYKLTNIWVTNDVETWMQNF